MNKITNYLAAALLLAFPGKGACQTNSAPKIGVINVLRAIVEC